MAKAASVHIDAYAALRNLESGFAYQYMAKPTAYSSFSLHDLPDRLHHLLDAELFDSIF